MVRNDLLAYQGADATVAVAARDVLLPVPTDVIEVEPATIQAFQTCGVDREGKAAG